MRTKPATLATAGKRLTGPPEGYGRKKELQVKHWLVGSAQHTSDAAGAATGAPEIIAEVSAERQQLGHHLLPLGLTTRTLDSSPSLSAGITLANFPSMFCLCLQPSLYPNQSLDDVYRQLRDSTDNIASVFDCGKDIGAAGVAAQAGAHKAVQRALLSCKQ